MNPLKFYHELEDLELDFNEPIKVDFQGESRDGTSFYAVNQYIVKAETLRELVQSKRDAIWHFGFDSLRIFLGDAYYNGSLNVSFVK